MLSNKWTFSLTSLVLMLAFCFVAPSALAQFEIKLSVGDGEDVSYADGHQVVYGTANSVEDADTTTINIMSTQVVNLSEATAETAARATDPVVSGTALGADDFTVIAYNKFDGTVSADLPTLGAVRTEETADGMHFVVTLDAVPAPTGAALTDGTGITRVLLVLKKDAVELADPREELYGDPPPTGKTAGARKPAGKNKEASIELHYVSADQGASGIEDDAPKVYAIKRAGGELRPVTAATFEALITLSEEPRKDGFKKDHIDASNATAGDPTFLDKIAQTATMQSSGRDMMLYRYIVVITPKYENKNDIVVKVKSFYDQEKMMPKMYMPPSQPAAYDEGIDKLTVKVGREELKDKVAGSKVTLSKDHFIPGAGYVVVVEDLESSEIVNPDPDDDVDNEPKSHQRGPATLMYNVQDLDIPNLETFLANGGVIDVMSPIPLVITEVMWGTDISLAPDVANSQWIELYNPGGQHEIAENTIDLMFYSHGERPPARAADGTLPAGVVDRIGTINDAGQGLWSLAGKGQGGRTGHGETAEVTLAAAVPYTNIISMFRLKAGAEWADGQMAASWMASSGASDNFDPAQPGHRVGTPGAPTDMTALEKVKMDAEAAKTKAATDKAAADKLKAESTGTIPMNGNVYISEVMVARGNNLPQWIEIANGSRTEEVNLSGWTLKVDNAAADTDVDAGASITFTLPAGTTIGMYGQSDSPSTVLVVTEAGRNNLEGAMAKGQILNLWESNQTELILADVTKRRYALLSEAAFLITLAPPEPEPPKAPADETKAAKATRQAAAKEAANMRKDASDRVGNLGADGTAAWALPMSMEGGRSSLIRSHIEVTRGPAEPEDGMVMDGWVLAAETSFAQAAHVRVASHYGAANDIGTPGFRAGGALPVELSHFRPARDRVTDAVVITWSTQSELNNAGFFIKRSQQRDGEFKVINATLVQGAGTTSEKQFYTYTDTTAQPNVVYYYQIEDVSLDGNRQTLTRGIRLKGHVSVAGKATTTWGDLKTHE